MRPRVGHEPLGTQVRRLRGWLLLGLVIAVMAAVATVFRVEVLPPSLERDSSEFAGATTQVLVEFPGDAGLLGTTYPVQPLAERANVYARLATSPAVVELIGEEAGIDPAAIDARGPYNPDAQRVQREPTAERRAQQLRAERSRYRLRFDSEVGEAVPLVLVYAQAPTTPEAESLANGAATGLVRYVEGIQRTEKLEPSKRLQLRQLGEARGGVVNPGANLQVAILAFGAALLAWTALTLLIHNLRELVRRREPVLEAPAAVPPPVAPRRRERSGRSFASTGR